MTESAPSGIVVTMRHVRMERMCARGTRQWFRAYDRDLLRRFCREGLPVEVLEALDDAFAQRVAAIARQEALAWAG